MPIAPMNTDTENQAGGVPEGELEARVQQLRLILVDLQSQVSQYERALLREGHVRFPNPRRLELIAEALRGIGRGLVEDFRVSEAGNGSTDLKVKVSQFERDLILSALDSAGQNQRAAAHTLGVRPSTLHEKMKRLGLVGRAPKKAVDR